MIFDRFAKVVETFFPKLVPVLQRAKLFVFPGRAHDILPENMLAENCDRMVADFFMPFQIVVVEDTMSCVLLIDSEKEQRGLNCVRHFLEYSELATGIEEADPKNDRLVEFNTDEKWTRAREDVLKEHPHLAMISHGKLFGASVIDIDDAGNGKIQHAYEMIEIKSCEPGVGATDAANIIRSKHDMKLTIEACVQNAWVAMKEINYFNSPEFFILEEKTARTDREMQKARKVGKVARRHARPRYTVLQPTLIRQRMGLPATPTGVKRAPHERRAHTRTFRSDKFVFMKGKTITIPARWIGPKQSTIGNKIYRVILDR